ncbi:hypothetical protein NHF40_00045 [Maricaulaceae bacterium EIL42A08]|nr:hypothetical protein [Maricaulaceae bacterium EIL42A08]
MFARLRLLFALILAAPVVSGCLVVAAVDTAAGIGGMAIGATGAVVGAAGDVVEGTVDVITPGSDDDDEDEGEEDREER